jgi:ribose transport system ATP-binding protein
MKILVRQGKIVIIISSELPELLGMSDRIYVMCEVRLQECLQEKMQLRKKL